jgi:hypothetical protein
MKNEKTDELDANQSLFNFASGRRHHRFPKTTPFAEISKGIASSSPRLPDDSGLPWVHVPKW